MEAKFNSTKTIGNILIAFILVAVAATLVFCFSYENHPMIIFFPGAVLLAMAVILSSFHGKIIANEEKITVVTTFFGKAVRRKNIEYNDIDRTDCGVDTVGNRLGSVSHMMTFTIRMKSGSKITVFKRLGIGASFPAEQPEKYKQYLHEQPLMKISHYIDSKLHLNASA